MNLLPEVSSLVDQLAKWLQIAKDINSDHDGLRSPSLDPSVSGGGWSTSGPERHVLSLDRKHVDERTGEAYDAQTAAARLARAEDDIAAARRALTCAWADAHRRPPAKEYDRCPKCDAQWSYVYRSPGSDVALPASRVYSVADGIHPVHLLCPDCGQRTYAEPKDDR